MQDYVRPAGFTAADVPSRMSESAFISHHDLKRFFKRYAATIWLTTAVGIAMAAVYVFAAVPLYTAGTTLVIDPSLPQVLRESRDDAIFSIDNSQVESQLEILRSEKIAGAVIDELGLESNPEFKSRIRSRDASLKRREMLALFAAKLSVRRVGLSYAIEILFSATNPELAAKVANATAEAYVDEEVAARAQAIKLSGEWLEERIDQLRRQMNKAALAVQEFRAKRDYRLDPAQESAKPSGGNEPSGNSHVNTLEELESTAQTYRQIYQSYLMAYTESVQKQSYPATNARIITAATPPLGKSHPRTKLILAFGALMGCITGLGIAFFRHNTDRSISNSSQVREEVGMECLASVPLLPSSRRSANTGRTIQLVDWAKRHILPSGQLSRSAAPESLDTAVTTLFSRFSLSVKELIRATISPSAEFYRGAASAAPESLDTAVTMPFSSFSFGIKKLKAAISIAGRGNRLHCIGITSALPGEGKTTIAANLAALFAQSGTSTLLIDGDLMNASLSKALAPAAKLGLLEAIKADAALNRCIVRPENAIFDFLPVAGGQNPAHDGILGSDTARKLIDDVKKEYELVIVEMPPLAANLDALSMGSMLDGTLLVVQWSKTPSPTVLESNYLLRNARVDTLGVVLNMVEPSMVNYGEVSGNYRGSYHR
jgi:polysaccharide biosynthesis transport protein